MRIYYSHSKRFFCRTSVSILFLFIIFATTNAFPGETSQQFTAVCKDIETHAYRYSTDMNGKVISNEFTSDEKFGSVWNFKYTGGDNLIIDGKKAVIIARTADGTILLAINGGANAGAVSAWSYAIHLKLKKIVASQVNAFTLLGDGVKARSVCLECEFK